MITDLFCKATSGDVGPACCLILVILFCNIVIAVGGIFYILRHSVQGEKVKKIVGFRISPGDERMLDKVFDATAAASQKDI